MVKSERSSMSEDNRLLQDSSSEDDFHYAQAHRAKFQSRSSRVLLVGLILSILVNSGFILFIGSKTSFTFAAPKHERSKYADLAWDLNIPFEWATDYANPNLTESGALWDAIMFDVGFVALPYEWTDSVDLPRAQEFPWDRTQGLYVINAYHALHCLKNVHRAIREYHFGLPQTLSMMHITHCMDSLRGDIMCQADDSPRYTTISKSPESAVGQIRQCRDWTKLEEWAASHTSCYNYISAAADNINQFERFKFCPKDSPYWPAVRKHFGKGDDWFGED